MNKNHQNILIFLKIDIEAKCCFSPLLDIEKTTLLLVVLISKIIFGGIYTKFNSLFALDYRFGYIYTILHRSFSSVSNLSKFYFEVSTPKKTSFKNDCSKYFTNKCVFILKGVLQVEIAAPSFPKRLSLPFLGNVFVKFF